MKALQDNLSLIIVGLIIVLAVYLFPTPNIDVDVNVEAPPAPTTQMCQSDEGGQDFTGGGTSNYTSTNNAFTGAVSMASTLSVTGATTLSGEVTMKEGSQVLAPTNIYSTTTLTAALSGTTYYLSASGTTITLPAVAEGLNFRFAINGAADSGNFIIDSSEGDNINGTLSVNNADVACSGEDQINFVTDGETIGDYVELRSDGTQWLIGDSGTETAAKMTCTDPS